MLVEFKARVGGREVTFSEECASDVAAFEFLEHMENLWGSSEQAVKTDADGKSVWSKRGATKLNVRRCEVKGKPFKYYEVVCTDPNPVLKGAKLVMGKTGQNGEILYPRIKDPESGEYLADKGWKRWDPELEKEV